MSREIFVIFFCLIHSLNPAQIPGLYNFTENDGLNSSYTYRLNQDKNGFIWIGSDNGLFRFDGTEFKQYGKDEGLKNIEVITGVPLSNGDIFIMPFLSDFSFLKNGKIININNSSQNEFGDSIPSISSNGDKLCIYNYQNPKNIFIYENGKFKKQVLFNSYKQQDLAAIKYDFNSHILYLKPSADYLIAYNIADRKFKKITDVEGNFVCESKGFIVTRKDKIINIYKFSGVYQLTKINSYQLNEDFIDAHIDINQKLWINLTKGGVLYFNQSLLEHKPLKSPLLLLEKYVINYVLVDTDGNIWFSSRNNGLFFITKAFFSNYLNFSRKENTVNIRSIAQDGIRIVLGYDKAAGSYYQNGKFKNLTFDRYNKWETKAVYASGHTLIFGFSDQFMIHNFLNGTSKIINNYTAKNIVPYTKNSVFFCTSNGLFTYNIGTEKIDALSRDRVYTVLPYAQDSVFMGNFRDLYKFNLKTKARKLFLEGYYFTDIKKIREHLYAGATNLNGIILFNNKGIVKKITKADGLVSDQIKRIDFERANTFWASTNSGISRIELKKDKVEVSNFTHTDGLPSNVISGCAIIKDSVFIATSKGLGVFSITKLLAKEKVIKKKVIINSVEFENKEYFNINLKLPDQQSGDVIFNVSFLDYASHGKIGYKYKIEGLNDTWQSINSSKIILNSIPPGKYIFKITGVGDNGRMSYVATEFPFEILPHFWQTLWFNFLCVVALLMILHLLGNFYFKKQRQKKLKILFHQKKNAEMELQAIKAQVNPHFIYNCLNSIQFLLCKGEFKQTENYLNAFTLLMRKTLHYSEKTFISIEEEIEYLSLYMNMEKLKENEFFDYEIQIGQNVNKKCVIPSLFIQPFVENSIKHGFSGLKNHIGLIKISFNYENNILSIEIEDNGRGFRSDDGLHIKDDSYGLKLSLKRIETFKQLFNTHITFDMINLSEKCKKNGTKINLYITPYDNKNKSQYR